MSQIDVVSVELDDCRRSLHEWAEKLSVHVGCMQPLDLDRQLTRWASTTRRNFSGCIELGALDNSILSKTFVTPHLLNLSFRMPNPKVPVVLVAQLSGSSRLEQLGRSCTLYPGDWCLIDTLNRFKLEALQSRNEHLNLTFERPSDPERLGLLERGAARRLASKAGISRVLQATLTETFNQMNRLGPGSRKSLQRAVTEMTWDALREQLEAPPPGMYRDVTCARIKNYIEEHIAEPELSVESVAQACRISVRSIHRAFENEPSGSISNYIWMRRLSHCSARLRDPDQVHRSITDICFSWGFNSTSHFSRLFKEHFGVPPREYRMASARGADGAVGGTSERRLLT